MGKKVTYIISDIEKALAFEWIVEELNTEKYDLSFILLNRKQGSFLENWLKEKQVPVFWVYYESKKQLFSAFSEVRKILKNWGTQVVHCHLFTASLVGLLAAKSLGIKKRIFTRHYSTFHHEYFPRAVWYDRFINALATHIVAISENVRNVLILKEKVNPAKIRLIHHGFRLELFENVSRERVENLKQKYHLQNKFPVIGVIARWTHWKGIQFIIPAFAEILKHYPQAHLILANAKGDYTTEIEKLLKNLPPQSYIAIPFENDLPALYQLFDVYVHTPINAEVEAFGQTYVEALAAKIPSVFTLSGVAKEFIHHQENAWVVPFQNSEKIVEAIRNLLENNELRSKIIKNSRESVEKMFNLRKMIRGLEQLYDE
ncbi:glycosyltransferase family 4 protein [Raineya orbicola]|uniref:Glycosyl transferases group 1 n=1 Tax=Raineya orbicola TaxID=2016530 RepID=A0A2N3IKZ3_9BACT|nr:glycosyltransferase family 4 protein [Raineya orbicola]PKQ70933.1 Glycosyl transferases group 1 [Raineya orbicola]